MTYRKPTKKPCSDCPFRRKAMPGWLGAADPESFVLEILREHPLPCHQTIDYCDLNWKAKWEAQVTGKICAGALILSANMGKLPRDRNFPRMKPDTTTVFARPQEFLDHHNNARVKSWLFDDKPRKAKK